MKPIDLPYKVCIKCGAPVTGTIKAHKETDDSGRVVMWHLDNQIIYKCDYCYYSWAEKWKEGKVKG